jgi:hypothetical protein
VRASRSEISVGLAVKFQLATYPCAVINCNIR